MKVHIFNHWFKHKVPIGDIWESTLRDKVSARPRTDDWRDSNFWYWLNEKFDVGQYYNWREDCNYLVFHNEQHYLMFLLRL